MWATWCESPQRGGDRRVSGLAVDVEMVAMAFEGQKNIGGQNGNNSRLGSQLRFGGQKFTSGKVWDIVSGACERLGGFLWAVSARALWSKVQKNTDKITI